MSCINNTSISAGLTLRPFYGIINVCNPTLRFWAVIYGNKSIFPPSGFKDLRCECENRITPKYPKVDRLI